MSTCVAGLPDLRGSASCCVAVLDDSRGAKQEGALEAVPYLGKTFGEDIQKGAVMYYSGQS